MIHIKTDKDRKKEEYSRISHKLHKKLDKTFKKNPKLRKEANEKMGEIMFDKLMYEGITKQRLLGDKSVHIKKIKCLFDNKDSSETGQKILYVVFH
eukprot:UN00454